MPALNEAVLNAFGHALFAGLATPIGSVIAFFAKQTDYRFLASRWASVFRQCASLGEPLNLFGIEIGAVEREEADTCLWAERVIEPSSHIQQLVEALLARVMVAKRRIEPHAGVQERLVRQFELLPEIPGSADPYKLSPTVTTNSYLNRWRRLAICSAR
jgi:hypothetical protein